MCAKGVSEMRVPVTEVKVRFGEYIERAADEDIIITKNGKDVALLTNVGNKRKEELKALRGLISDTNMTRDQIREERLGKYHADRN